MTLIYVVRGYTGEYSDRDEWDVAAYKEEALAQQHVKLASAYARHATSDYSPASQAYNNSNPYDPKMHVDYTGTTYSYETIELHDVLFRRSDVPMVLP